MKKRLPKIKSEVIKHQTEAWADIHHYEGQARVPIPTEAAMENAKEWVDEHEV